MRSVIVRASAGLYLSVLLAPLATFLVLRLAPPVHLSCKIIVASALYAIIAAILHEALHLATALVAGVQGVKLRILYYLALLVLDYSEMTPRQFILVALAPQLLDPLLLAASLIEPLTIPSYTALAVNIAAGVADIINALFIALFHNKAKRIKPLYDEDGRITGTVIEYSDYILVYMF